MARTKIVATIGPASSDKETMRRMLLAGMNVARMNYSHGSHASNGSLIKSLREVAAEEKRVLAIMGDLQGPKIRIGDVPSDGLDLEVGDKVILTSKTDIPGAVHVPHEELIDSVEPGAQLVIGDGEVEMKVLEKSQDAVRCEVTVPGLLESRKGIAAPDTHISIPSINEKDIADLGHICELGLDYVALSFVRSADDIRQLRDVMVERGMRVLPIIAKIETKAAIGKLDGILEEADGVMVARGDLGIEMHPEDVPFLQKKIINDGNETGKPVITATQMLQSMVDSPRPTRAEASDVANAILDGTDAVMLSQETTVGNYPVEAVQMMKRISEITEKEFPYDRWRIKRQQRREGNVTISDAISTASCAIAEEVNAEAIICTTMSGYTARQIARHRPATPIIAVSAHVETKRQLALVWGVESIIVERSFKNTDEMLEQTLASITSLRFKKGDTVVITAGIPFGQRGQSNLIKVHRIT